MLPWPHRWNVLAICVLFQAFTIGVMVYCFTLLVGPFMKEFGVDRAPVVAAATFSGLVIAIASPVVGWTVDRFAMHRIAALGLVLFCVGILLLAVASSLWQILILYSTLLPVGASLAGPITAQTLVTRWFKEQRGVALGISASGTSFGGLVLPPVVALLIEAIGWRTVHLYLAALGLALVLPITWLVLRTRSAESRISHNFSVSQKGSQSSAVPILRRPVFWILVACAAPLAFVFSSIQYNIGPLAADRDVGTLTLGYAMSVFAGSMIVGKLAFGAFSDRVENRVLLWACAGLICACIVALTTGSSVESLLLGVTFLGLAGGGFLPLISAITAQRFDESEFGRVFGLSMLFTNISLFGPLITAALRDIVGSYTLTLQVMVLVLAPPVVMAFMLGARQIRKGAIS